ncbi:MAG: helix-turn-helix domain-containing protein, partial [Nitrosopumilaceae archaeon]
GKIRVITEINKENIHYCKELLNYVDEIRHLDDVTDGLAVSDTAYMTTTILRAAKPLTQVVYSDVPEAVHQQQNLFNNLWERAVPAARKIRDIDNLLNLHQKDIFSAIDNATRRSILFHLREKQMKGSQISKKLGISLQAFQKHISKLYEVNLISKNSNGMISLTQTGFALTEQIPSIQFLSENKEFFQTHSLSFLPTEFVQRIGDIQNHEKISGLPKIIKKLHQILEESTEYSKFIDWQRYFETTQISLSKLLSNSKKIQCISTQDKTSQDGNELFGKNNKTELNFKKTIEVKFAKNLNFLPYLSNQSAMVMFPDLNGVPDTNTTLFSKDERFIGWCSDLFDFIWKNSRISVG